MTLPIFQVDAFTARAFSGNPAAVCILSKPCEAEWMQKVAAEMNLSETAFLSPRAEGYDLRWFTPTVEVDLCGHATLASAHILWETGRLAANRTARFQTQSGLLVARREDDWIELDLPTYTTMPIAPPVALLGGLGTPAVAVLQADDGCNCLVELESESAVRELNPDFHLLAQLTTSVIVTARSDDPQVDFVSRYFGPAIGIDEDPVTGSAHCVLGPYWQSRLNKSELVAHQVSRRGGFLRVRVANDRTLIAGQAITVLRGELVVP